MTVSSHVLDRLEERVGELLAARSAERTDFSGYADRPVAFMREILGFEPWQKQREICESVLHNKRTVVRGHHAAGKDAILAALLLWAHYARQMRCIAVSATERQVIGQLWAEVARLWAGAGVFGGELYVGELRVAGEREIIAMTSASTSNLTGWHNHRGTGVFVAISESQAEQIGSVAFDAAEGNTAGAGSRIVVVGNPVKPQGRFYEATRKPTWSAIRISAFDHPNVREGRTIIPGGPSPTWPEEMAGEYGADSAFYVSRVLGEFPTEGSVDALIQLGWLEGAYARHEAGAPWLLGDPLPVLALDVARSLGRDENVAAIAHGPRLHALHAWRSRDLVDTAARFLALADRTRSDWHSANHGRATDPDPSAIEDPDELARWLELQGVPHFPLYVDAPGIGGGVIDDVRRRERVVHEWWGWAPARDGGRMANLRSESFWTFRKLLEDGEAALPRDSALHEEALAMEWSLDSRGRIVMLSKDDLRKTLGRSPDRLDAAVMAMHNATAVRGPTVFRFKV